MSFWDNLKKLTQPYADEEYDDYDEDLDGFETDDAVAAEESPRETSRRARRSPFASVSDNESSYSSEKSASYSGSSYSASESGSAGFSGQVINMGDRKQDVVLFHAKSFDDAARAADELRKRRAVILNMENVDKALTRRVVDFLSGAVYALDGSVRKIAQATYLFCPHNMNVVGDLENVQRDGSESYI